MATRDDAETAQAESESAKPVGELWSIQKFFEKRSGYNEETNNYAGCGWARSLKRAMSAMSISEDEVMSSLQTWSSNERDYNAAVRYTEFYNKLLYELSFENVYTLAGSNLLNAGPRDGIAFDVYEQAASSIEMRAILNDVTFRRLVRGQLYDPEVERIKPGIQDASNATRDDLLIEALDEKSWKQRQDQQKQTDHTDQDVHATKTDREPSNVKNYYRMLFHGRLAVNESSLEYWKSVVGSMHNVSEAEFKLPHDAYELETEALKIGVWWVTFSRHFVYQRLKELKRLVAHHKEKDAHGRHGRHDKHGHHAAKDTADLNATVYVLQNTVHDQGQIIHTQQDSLKHLMKSLQEEARTVTDPDDFEGKLQDIVRNLDGILDISFSEENAAYAERMKREKYTEMMKHFETHFEPHVAPLLFRVLSISKTGTTNDTVDEKIKHITIVSSDFWTSQGQPEKIHETKQALEYIKSILLVSESKERGVWDATNGVCHQLNEYKNNPRSIFPEAQAAYENARDKCAQDLISFISTHKTMISKKIQDKLAEKTGQTISNDMLELFWKVYDELLEMSLDIDSDTKSWTTITSLGQEFETKYKSLSLDFDGFFDTADAIVVMYELTWIVHAVESNLILQQNSILVRNKIARARDQNLTEIAKNPLPVAELSLVFSDRKSEKELIIGDKNERNKNKIEKINLALYHLVQVLSLKQGEQSDVKDLLLQPTTKMSLFPLRKKGSFENDDIITSIKSLVDLESEIMLLKAPIDGKMASVPENRIKFLTHGLGRILDMPQTQRLDKPVADETKFLTYYNPDHILFELYRIPIAIKPSVEETDNIHTTLFEIFSKFLENIQQSTSPDIHITQFHNFMARFFGLQHLVDLKTKPESNINIFDSLADFNGYDISYVDGKEGKEQLVSRTFANYFQMTDSRFFAYGNDQADMKYVRSFTQFMEYLVTVQGQDEVFFKTRPGVVHSRFKSTSRVLMCYAGMLQQAVGKDSKFRLLYHILRVPGVKVYTTHTTGNPDRNEIDTTARVRNFNAQLEWMLIQVNKYYSKSQLMTVLREIFSSSMYEQNEDADEMTNTKLMQLYIMFESTDKKEYWLTKRESFSGKTPLFPNLKDEEHNTLKNKIRACRLSLKNMLKYGELTQKERYHLQNFPVKMDAVNVWQFYESENDANCLDVSQDSQSKFPGLGFFQSTFEQATGFKNSEYLKYLLDFNSCVDVFAKAQNEFSLFYQDAINCRLVTMTLQNRHDLDFAVDVLHWYRGKNHWEDFKGMLVYAVTTKVDTAVDFGSDQRQDEFKTEYYAHDCYRAINSAPNRYDASFDALIFCYLDCKHFFRAFTSYGKKHHYNKIHKAGSGWPHAIRDEEFQGWKQWNDYRFDFCNFDNTITAENIHAMKLSGSILMMVVPKVMDYFLGCLCYPDKFYVNGILYLAEQLYYLLEVCQNKITQHTIPSFSQWRNDNFDKDNNKYVGILDVEGVGGDKVLKDRIKKMGEMHAKIDLHGLDKKFAEQQFREKNAEKELSLSQESQPTLLKTAELQELARKKTKSNQVQDTNT